MEKVIREKEKYESRGKKEHLPEEQTERLEDQPMAMSSSTEAAVEGIAGETGKKRMTRRRSRIKPEQSGGGIRERTSNSRHFKPH